MVLLLDTGLNCIIQIIMVVLMIKFTNVGTTGVISQEICSLTLFNELLKQMHPGPDIIYIGSDGLILHDTLNVGCPILFRGDNDAW